MPQFKALQEIEKGRGQLVAVDIGYSETSASCGVAWAGGEACCLQFGQCLDYVVSIVQRHPDRVVLVLEAPLSTCHDAFANPTIRGSFESGRGWYYGAGATVTLAVMRLVDQLARRTPQGSHAVLAEAFLSRKSEPSRHADDAAVILRDFWTTRPSTLKPGVEPICGIVGVPPVRAFPPARAD